jgi:hypothetical protein
MVMGLKIMVTVQSGFRTRDISITGPARLLTALTRPTINDIRKNRGDNPIQDSPVKESAIRLFNENTTPDTDSTETGSTLKRKDTRNV